MALRFAAGVALIVAAVFSGSCHTGPTDPSDNVNETFTGTVPVGTGNFKQHTFTASNDGEIFITLATLTPTLPSGKFALLSLGLLTNGNCTYNGAVQSASALPGTRLSLVVAEGTFCVALFDKGDFTVDETYEISVSHP